MVMKLKENANINDYTSIPKYGYDVKDYIKHFQSLGYIVIGCIDKDTNILVNWFNIINENKDHYLYLQFDRNGIGITLNYIPSKNNGTGVRIDNYFEKPEFFTKEKINDIVNLGYINKYKYAKSAELYKSYNQFKKINLGILQYLEFKPVILTKEEK